ncbi:MAG: helix-turn-helix domain-containing protein [Rickettsiales bacterium]
MENQKDIFCPVEITLSLIAGKWKLIIIYYLLRENMRFNQLQRSMNGITHRSLSKQLKEMEKDGLIIRNDYGEIPPRVEYSLSELGVSLKPVLIAMEKWAKQDSS